MTPAEPVTVILSEMGWVRCAKGHDIDPIGLSYKAGDKYLAHACGKSNQPVILLIVLVVAMLFRSIKLTFCAF